MANSEYRVHDYVEYHGGYTRANPEWMGLHGHVVKVDRDGDVTVEVIFSGRESKYYLWACENIRKMPPPRRGYAPPKGHQPPPEPAPAAPVLGVMSRALPTDSNERKRWPMFNGLLAYFPAALGRVSNHSYLGNEKHNPGLPLQHARGKSGDHEDCIVRHLVDAKEFAPGSDARLEELCACAWRALALLQEECELGGAPAAPAATFTVTP